jgi:hypothetical protein
MNGARSPLTAETIIIVRSTPDRVSGMGITHVADSVMIKR